MDPFAGVLPFVHTAEEKSFHRAAARLGVTTAAVSKAVARLEAQLGVVLLHRTSRRVSLTPEGETFLARCRVALAEVQAGRDLVAQSQKVVEGPLRVSLSPILARLVIPAVARLLARHPRVDVRLFVTDRKSRLADEQIDVALRVGALEDSSLVARKLRSPRWVTVASPGYLARRGVPARPEDLAHHEAVKFVSPRGVPHELELRDPRTGNSIATKVPCHFHVDQGDLLLDAAMAGAGLCQALDFMVNDLLRDGRLVEVLGEWAAPGPLIHALCLPRRHVSPRVRAFLDALEITIGRDRGA